jgi:hypothetical protein
MPLVRLQTADLADVIRALRVLALQARKDAERQGRTSTRHIFEESAERHEKLAAEMEAVWRAETSAK